MSDNPKIERRIQEILRGSRLPAERRAEVAEEFRGHLEQLVEAKRRANADDAATQAALAAFGEVEVIRRHLRQRQGAEDHRQVLVAMRSRLRLLLILPALLPLYVGVLGILGAGILPGALFASAIYVVLLAGGFVVLYPLLLARIRVAHRLPAGECHPLVTAGLWFATFALSLVLSEVIFACGFIGSFGILVALDSPKGPPFVGVALSKFLWDFLRMLVPVAGPPLLIMAGLLAVFLAGVQRWRCVPEG